MAESLADKLGLPKRHFMVKYLCRYITGNPTKNGINMRNTYALLSIMKLYGLYGLRHHLAPLGH